MLSKALRANVLINKIQFFIDPRARLVSSNPIYNSAVHYQPTTKHRFICDYELMQIIRTVMQPRQGENTIIGSFNYA